MKNLPLPAVGVVIVNYNAAAYVAQCIQSVAAQTVTHVEVIVVDDFSTDKSVEVIRDTLDQLGDTRFRFLPLTENVGQTGAARRGMTKLHTPFICFLDSDDLWYENFLERHLAVHLNSDFPVGVTYCDSHFVNAQGEMLAGTAWWFGRTGDNPEPRPVDPIAIPAIDTANGLVVHKLKEGMTLYEDWSTAWSSNSTSSMMFRRALVELVLSVPDNDLRLYMDTYLSTFAVLISGAIAIDEPLYAYRMHGNNQHSNGAVLGGIAPTSRKAWGPIYERVLSLVHRELSARPEAFTGIVAPERYGKALAQVTAALTNLDPSPKEGAGLAGALRKLFGGRT